MTLTLPIVYRGGGTTDGRWSYGPSYTIFSKSAWSLSWLTFIYAEPICLRPRWSLAKWGCPLTTALHQSAAKGRYNHVNDAAIWLVLHHYVQQKSMALTPQTKVRIKAGTGKYYAFCIWLAFLCGSIYAYRLYTVQVAYIQTHTHTHTMHCNQMQVAQGQGLVRNRALVLPAIGCCIQLLVVLKIVLTLCNLCWWWCFTCH